MQMLVLSFILFEGKPVNQIPHPEIDWPQFEKRVAERNSALGKIFCVLFDAKFKWVDEKHLRKIFGPASSVSCSVS